MSKTQVNNRIPTGNIILRTLAMPADTNANGEEVCFYLNDKEGY